MPPKQSEKSYDPFRIAATALVNLFGTSSENKKAPPKETQVVPSGSIGGAPALAPPTHFRVDAAGHPVITLNPQAMLMLQGLVSGVQATQNAARQDRLRLLQASPQIDPVDEDEYETESEDEYVEVVSQRNKETALQKLRKTFMESTGYTNFDQVSSDATYCLFATCLESMSNSATRMRTFQTHLSEVCKASTTAHHFLMINIILRTFVETNKNLGNTSSKIPLIVKAATECIDDINKRLNEGISNMKDVKELQGYVSRVTSHFGKSKKRIEKQAQKREERLRLQSEKRSREIEAPRNVRRRTEDNRPNALPRNFRPSGSGDNGYSLG